MAFFDWIKDRFASTRESNGKREQHQSPPPLPQKSAGHSPRTVMPQNVKPVSLTSKPMVATPRRFTNRVPVKFMPPPNLSEAGAETSAASKETAAPDHAPSARTADPEHDFSTRTEVQLPVSSFKNNLPRNLINYDDIDDSRIIHFKTAEFARGLAKGRPEAQLSTVYAQYPDIFKHEIPEGDSETVLLPLNLLVQQIGEFNLRDDQYEEESPREIFDTPFLQAALAEGDKVSTEPSPAEQQPDPEPEPESQPQPAETSEAAGTEEETSPTLQQEEPKTQELRDIAGPKLDEPAEPPAQQKPQPKIPARRTGRIPMPKMSPPSQPAPAPAATSEAEQPEPEVKQPEPAEPQQKASETPAAAAGKKSLSLPLVSVYERIPPHLLKHPEAEIAEEWQLKIPLEIVQPQLATGRVVITIEQLQKLLPEDRNDIFTEDADGNEEVQLPLQQLLAAAPEQLFQRRDDQIETRVAREIETPFAQKAREDADRLAQNQETEPADEQPEPQPAVEAVEETAEEPETAAEEESPEQAAPEETEPAADEEEQPQPEEPAAADEPDFDQSVLQEIFMTDEELTGRRVAELTAAFPSIASCLITTSDGLRLAGDSGDIEADAMAAVSPHLFKKVAASASECELGTLRSLTLHSDHGLATFFKSNGVCLVVRHTNRDLPAGVRNRLQRIAEEVSKMYSRTTAKEN